MGTTEKLYYFYGSYSVQPSARLHRKRGIWPRMQCWWLLTQSLELARARMTPANSRAKQMKQSLSFVKTFVQRVTFSVAVITTLQELLRVEDADPGADLLTSDAFTSVPQCTNDYDAFTLGLCIVCRGCLYWSTPTYNTYI